MSQKANMLSVAVGITFLLISTSVQAAIDCPPSVGGGNESSLFDFGDPALFVTTVSQQYDPHSLVDHHRRTSILEEYLMVGYHKSEDQESLPELVERFQLILYDGVKKLDAKASDKPDLVHQNLQKVLYWRYFKSTGMYPSMTIINATTRISVQFQADNQRHNETDDITFTAVIGIRNYFQEPQVPYLAVFEIPANSRVLREHKTLIEYQSFSLWRWKLSHEVVEWKDITNRSDEYTNDGIISSLRRIDNPCIKDMFLVIVPRSSKTNQDEKLVYLGSPLIQAHLGESWFYDMKTASHPWWPDAPETIILTNDHLVVLTNFGMWISNSLNDSSNPNVNLEMTGNYTSRPNLTYTSINPCRNFRETIDCFIPENGTNNNHTKHRLLYTPVCYLHQFPDYDDYLIFTNERTLNLSGELVTDFSVLYSAKPYTNWRILFSNVAFYKMFRKSELGKAQDTSFMIQHALITSVVGIFFNHHLRHFDITLKLKTLPRYVRFVLPEPSTAFDGYGELLTREQLEKSHAPVERLRQLNATLGVGFPEYEFPENFEMEDVVVNPNTLDVFFLGNQFWIAEAGGPFVYTALASLSSIDDSACPDRNFSNSRIRECSFSHPDKIYVCMNQDRRLLITGKIGSRYSPSVVRVDTIRELVSAQKVNPWVVTYSCDLMQTKSVFAAAYSGRVLFWYLHDPDEEANTANAEIAKDCNPSQASNQAVLCASIKLWKQNGCNASPSGKPGFRLVVIDGSKLTSRIQNTDGPLAPFLLDSNTAVLYEGIVPPQVGLTYDYFNEVFVGQKVYCTNYDLEKVKANDKFLHHNCELFTRHIKPIESFLDGLRRAVYVTVIKSIPLLTVPADVVVLVQPNSNKALVQINDYINNPAWIFSEDHIGQTLYIPGNFSILLAGFPIENELSIMEGYTTMFFQYEQRLIFHAFHVFLMDLSTQAYRKAQIAFAAERINQTKQRWNETDTKNTKTWEKLNETRELIKKRWEKSQYSFENGINIPLVRDVLPPTIPREQEERQLLLIKQSEQIPISGQPHSWTKFTPPNGNDLVHGNVDYKDKLIWYVSEGECHYVMSLVNNPVLKTSGGRISLDLYDRISFEVLLRPLTPIGKLLMYRPLLVVTNSNPDVLKVETKEKLKGAPQYIQFLLSPTGYRKGVAVVTVRVRVSSLHCQSSTSVTLIVLCHRDVGRRLHVNYPVPTCKPEEDDGMYPRPWFNEMEGCIKSEELLDPTKEEIYRYRGSKKLLAYISLPPNYRPPSFDGTDVPQTRNVYNADPSKPAYTAKYQISKQTIELNRCAGKSAKSECICSAAERLMDDEQLTECKEKVFATRRTGTGEPITISISYDRIMRDRDQNPELFLPKQNWSITIEEVNGRGEWYITSEYTPYLRMINTDPELHRGRRYYDMNNLKVTLLGTGLFHFKAKLGSFESFDSVTGYFILYSSTHDINHIHMFIILLGTIILCMTLVLIGFLVNRKRLSSMLPIQPMSHKKKLKLL